MTEPGLERLARIGIEIDGPAAGRTRSSRPLCRPCLDWSERRAHLAGKLGAAIAKHYFERGYVRRIRETRALDVTPRGRQALHDMFGVAELV